MDHVSLTRRQRDILDYLQSYIRRHAISPTLEEIAGALGVNKVTIFGHVAEMERKGVLKRSAKGVSRALSPTLEERSDSDVIPIRGTIAAGLPIETLEANEHFELGSMLPPSAECYALRVRGNSMIEDGIHDGDLVLVESCRHALDGQTVVAVLPGEVATLKRYYREGKKHRLQPANATLESVIVDELEIRGVVIGLIRTHV